MFLLFFFSFFWGEGKVVDGGHEGLSFFFVVILFWLKIILKISLSCDEVMPEQCLIIGKIIVRTGETILNKYSLR